ncbi:MAG: hypothetical protein FJ290_16930 [Planctomycetes bacterium]|nr:hypothetical protein [Planctomycetota bacterium]
MRNSLAGIFLLVTGLPATARAAVATDSFPAGDQGPHPKAIQVATSDGGKLITVKLDGLDKAAKVHRARLYAWRGPVADASELLVAIEVYPGRSAAGKPLALVGPWFDCFDATEAVSAALRAGGELSLFVKAFPAWQPERTRLDVMYEGKPSTSLGPGPGQGPPAVKGLKALHRAGQTFLTWSEVEPLIAAEKATWGEIRKKLAETKDACTYRVYTDTKPIQAENLPEAEFLAEVAPLSCWNVNGRNMEYLIGQAMVKSDEIGEVAFKTGGFMYTWGPDSPRMDRYPVSRFVVDERAGPLAPGTALYVHSPKAGGGRFYAVVSCRNGVENTADFSPANALEKAVEETPGAGEPVCQGNGLWGPFFDYPGRRKVYVQWCAPPLAPLPSMCFNWSVLVPADPKAIRRVPGDPTEVDIPETAYPKGDRKLPAELYFHDGNFSYAKPRKKFLLESIQLAPHDFPASGWYGFNDAFGTLKSYSQGIVGNHTQRRIMAFLDWAKAKFPIDPDRVVLPGSDGAALLALNYPDAFAYVLINVFEGEVLDEKAQAKYAAIWGPKDPAIKDDQGRSEWSWAMLDELVKARPGKDLPLFVCKGYSWGPFIKGFAKGLGRFYDSMLKAHQPLVADWTWASGQLVVPDKHTALWRGLDIARTTPVPAFANCSTDKNSEGDGQHNLFLGWRDLKDEPEGASVVLTCHRDASFDLAFRRLQRFKAKPGDKLLWEARSDPIPRLTVQPDPRSGDMTVDAEGRIILKGIGISGRANLTVKVSRAK